MTTKDCDCFVFFFETTLNQVFCIPQFLCDSNMRRCWDPKILPRKPWIYQALMVNVRLKQFRAGAIVGPSSFLQPLNLSGVPY